MAKEIESKLRSSTVMYGICGCGEELQQNNKFENELLNHALVKHEFTENSIQFLHKNTLIWAKNVLFY